MPRLEPPDSVVIFRNPAPGHRSVHASASDVVALGPAEFLCAFRRGSAFYSDDSEIALARSTDGGRSWQDGGVVWDRRRDDRPYTHGSPFLTRLDDGTLLIAAYRCDRFDPSRLIVHPQTGGFLPVEHLLYRSTDGGRTWSDPTVMELPEGMILDIAGPVVPTPDERWLVPWDQGKPYEDPNPVDSHQLALYSDDGGRTWGDPVYFADSRPQGVGYWHGRVVRRRDGRLLCLTWTGDLRSGSFMPIHRVEGDPTGRRWSAPEPTNLPGQTSWPVDLGGGRVVAVYSRRDVPNPGIMAALSTDDGRTFDLERQVRVWDATGRDTMGVPVKDSYPQSHDVIAFGKPQAIPISDDEVLATFWCTESCITHVRSARLRVVD